MDEEEDIEKDEEGEEPTESENKLLRYKKDEKFGKSSSVSWKNLSLALSVWLTKKFLYLQL